MGSSSNWLLSFFGNNEVTLQEFKDKLPKISEVEFSRQAHCYPSAGLPWTKLDIAKLLYIDFQRKLLPKRSLDIITQSCLQNLSGLALDWMNPSLLVSHSFTCNNTLQNMAFYAYSWLVSNVFLDILLIQDRYLHKLWEGRQRLPLWYWLVRRLQ